MNIEIALDIARSVSFSALPGKCRTKRTMTNRFSNGDRRFCQLADRKSDCFADADGATRPLSQDLIEGQAHTGLLRPTIEPKNDSSKF